MGVWVDTDMGADDLFALLMARKRSTIDGISLTFGCTRLEQVIRNADGVAAVFGLNAPIYRGASCSILGTLETAERILGPDGMRGRTNTLPADAPACTRPGAVEALAAWLDGHAPSTATILALGPLTNIAALALVRPDLLARVHRIVWMGGARGRGNHTPSAEFNAFADPEALAVLLSRGAPITMVDLDACRPITIEERHVERVAGGPGANASLTASLLGGYLDIGLTRGRPAMALYDPVAAAAFLEPTEFDVASIGLEVELAGSLTRGRTVVDFGKQPSNAEIVTPKSTDAIRELCLTTLEAS